MMSQPSSTSPVRTPITDSPWFWLALFSVGGIAAVLLIEQQYRPRQRRLEMQYRAQEEILRRQAAGEPAARGVGQEGGAPPPTERELIIPLWPLIGVCLLVFAMSVYMIWRGRTTLMIFEQKPARDER
jgi:hypothetical protein